VVLSAHARPKIQDYAVIGDCRSAALISRAGSLDWLCWPRFDSPAIFAALLDYERGGRWSIAPEGEFETERSYIAESNVLETRFKTATGSATLTDLMPVSTEEFKHSNLNPDHEIVRRIRCTTGEVRLLVDFHPRAGYGLRPLRLQQRAALGVRIESRRGVYWLRSSHPLELQHDRATAVLSLKQGETAYYSLTYSEESPVVLPPVGGASDAAIERSVMWWRDWSQRCQYRGPYRDAVVRSALVLKLLTYAPSGAITAAATTSLPERIGDELNWDYRYCWLRDASLTTRAMLGLGYRDEAESFLGWLLNATRLTHPELRVLYTVFGREVPKEQTLPHLRGYRDSRPVRVGNGAREQLQLDIYGEVVEAAGHYADHGGSFDHATQKVLRGLGKYVAKHWEQPDEGIWEPRTGRAHRTYSRLLCWTALDRLLALSERGMVSKAPVDEFRTQRERIAQQLRERAWNPQLQSYVATLDGADMDACLLRLPWYGFEPADSERMRSTYATLCRALDAGGGLLYRYPRNPAEGAFGICGFWAVEYLALGGGTLEQAHRAFERLLRYRNDLGIFSEETDPASGDALGNFPQSFTHVGLISAALSIAEGQQQQREHKPRHPASHRQPAEAQS
jgi:GH15 family glucan-1,4-alpha-glucosidase